MNTDIPLLPKGSYFVTGIDTDAGKTFATAWLTVQLINEGHSVITQKFIQTGNPPGYSEDVEAHRRLAGMSPTEEDRAGLTAPLIFSYPASAQLAARIDGRDIDLNVVDAARRSLEESYDIVLVEGAGGLMVPITDTIFAIDYAATQHLPLILVTNGRLGSINHTVLSLEAIHHRGLPLAMVLYNTYFDADPIISADSRNFIERYVCRHFSNVPVLDIPILDKGCKES